MSSATFNWPPKKKIFKLYPRGLTEKPGSRAGSDATSHKAVFGLSGVKVVPKLGQHYLHYFPESAEDAQMHQLVICYMSTKLGTGSPELSCLLPLTSIKAGMFGNI